MDYVTLVSNATRLTQFTSDVAAAVATAAGLPSGDCAVTSLTPGSVVAYVAMSFTSALYTRSQVMGSLHMGGGSHGWVITWVGDHMGWLVTWVSVMGMLLYQVTGLQLKENNTLLGLAAGIIYFIRVTSFSRRAPSWMPNL